MKKTIKDKGEKKIITIKVYSVFNKNGEEFSMKIKGKLSRFAKECIVRRMIEDYETSPYQKITTPINDLIHKVFKYI